MAKRTQAEIARGKLLDSLSNQKEVVAGKVRVHPEFTNLTDTAPDTISAHFCEEAVDDGDWGHMLTTSVEMARSLRDALTILLDKIDSGEVSAPPFTEERDPP